MFRIRKLVRRFSFTLCTLLPAYLTFLQSVPHQTVSPDNSRTLNIRFLHDRRRYPFRWNRWKFRRSIRTTAVRSRHDRRSKGHCSCSIRSLPHMLPRDRAPDGAKETVTRWFLRDHHDSFCSPQPCNCMFLNGPRVLIGTKKTDNTCTE